MVFKPTVNKIPIAKEVILLASNRMSQAFVMITYLIRGNLAFNLDGLLVSKVH